MTLRKSEAVLRMMVALALGFGLIGYATHGHTAHAEAAELAGLHTGR